MAKELDGKTALVTGATSGIGLASADAMLDAGAHVIMVSNDQAALDVQKGRHGDTVSILNINLLDAEECKALVPKALELKDHIDIMHANAGMYIGGDLVDNDTDAIDRMLNLNVNVVMKNVRDILPHMIERNGGDIIVTSSLAAHYPTPWEPIYASSKWAIDAFVKITRRQIFKHGIRMGSISPGPVETALVADWEPERLQKAKDEGSLLEAKQVGDVVMFMLTRARTMNIRDVVMMPTNFDL